MLTVPPGVFPGDPLAVTWEGAEYEVLAPEGVAAGEREVDTQLVGYG
tara:strand:- start:131 stop:271 length:141 start_codon:yes stop_codon:yes gene_type:complete